MALSGPPRVGGGGEKQGILPQGPQTCFEKRGSLYVYAYDVCSWLHACDVCGEGVVYYVYGQSMNLIMCAIIPTQT